MRMMMDKISVIICTHRNERYNDFVDAMESLKAQSSGIKKLEIVAVVDGNKELYNKIQKSGIADGAEAKLMVILNEENIGLSASRNRGIEAAKGDVIAFFDDDAVADVDWIKELLRIYEEKDAIAVGGKLLPKWMVKKPNFLPEEFWWLVGATHKGFANEDAVSEVRNTFGSNLSFKRDVLEKLGGFRSGMGVKGRGQLQGEETELCDRMSKKFGKGVIYNPDAVVYHKVFSERLKLHFLLRRAFWQGYSKRAMKEAGHPLEEENTFLKIVFGGFLERTAQILFLFLFTFAVIVGYVVKAICFKFGKSV